MSTVVKKWFVLCLSVLGFIISVNTWADDVKPKDGKWQGSPSVSFTIKEKDKVSDFAISVPLAMGKCDLRISQIPLTKKGEIEFSHPKKYFSINGKFKTPTSIEGKVTIKICPDPGDKNNVVMLVPWEKVWKAYPK